MNKKQIFLAGLLMSVSAMQSGVAFGKQSANFSFTGIVHTVCRLDFAGGDTREASGMIDFGNFTQLCNSAYGYRVTMRHPANMNGAVLLIDGRSVPLSSGNETVIIDANHAADKISSAQLDVHGTDVPATNLSFRIEPKGAIY